MGKFYEVGKGFKEGKIIWVTNQDLWNLINTSNKVIEEVKKALHRGPANQLNLKKNQPAYTMHDQSNYFQQSYEAKVKTTEIAMASYFDWRRLAKEPVIVEGKKYYYEDNFPPKNPAKEDFYLPEAKASPNEDKPMRIAAAALANKTGYCTEHAAVTYIKLRDALPSNVHIYYGKHKIIHWYCLASLIKLDIKKDGHINEECFKKFGSQIVVVDPWYPRRKAEIWERSDGNDHFFVLKHGTGFKGGDYKKEDHAKAKYEYMEFYGEERIKQQANKKWGKMVNKAKSNSHTTAEDLGRHYIMKDLPKKMVPSMYGNPHITKDCYKPKNQNW